MMTITRIAELIPTAGDYAWPLQDVSGLHRDDGSASQPGDVLSVQPDGGLETRPATAIGPWETFTIEGPYFVYRTNGSKTVLILPPGL
jgi:hypothetical protein